MTLQDNTHIEERTIAIKVIRVGTRQLTQSLFKQFPTRHPIDAETGHLIGELWGRVVLPDHKKTYILWETEEALFSYLLDRIGENPPNLPSLARALPAFSLNKALIYLYHELKASNIILSLDEDKLQFQAPKGAMTPGLVEAIKEHREAIRETLPYINAYYTAWQGSYNSIIGTEQLFIGA
jgi:hypothetical protein